MYPRQPDYVARRARRLRRSRRRLQSPGCGMSLILLMKMRLPPAPWSTSAIPPDAIEDKGDHISIGAGPSLHDGRAIADRPARTGPGAGRDDR